ncbi:MAG: ABC transporter substrate-binding protein [Cytophagales bacterium]|nr:ABC transporter substrate-binding protein [Rhizobacter sp.]
MKRRNLVFAGPAALAAGMVGGASYSATPQGGNVIKFGQSASLTGGQASYGRDIRDGIIAAFAAASAVPGSPRFELVTLDDGGVKDRCIQNVSTLVEGGVSAIVGLTSGIAAEACVPIANNSQLALLGTASGNMGLRNGSASGVFHVRAGYDLEYKRMANYIKDFGMRRIGYVYLKDTSPANLAVMQQALSSVSIVPIEAIAIDRAATSFEDVSAKLLAAKLDCVLISANAGPVATIIDQMTTGRYAGLFYASSYAGQGLMDTLTAKKQSCIMSMVVPRPNSGSANVVNRAKLDFAALGSEVKLGITTMEGYIAGRTAVEAARVALKVSGGERISRARMKESLAALRTDLGGYRVEFAPGVTQGSQYVDLIAIDRYGRLVG